MQTLHLSYMMMANNPVYPEFKSDAGYWGTDFPRQLVNTPRSPFVLVDADGKQGLYMGLPRCKRPAHGDIHVGTEARSRSF